MLWLPNIRTGLNYNKHEGRIQDVIIPAAARPSVVLEQEPLVLPRAQIQATRMREVETLDLVAREIAEAYAQVMARKRRTSVSEQGIKAAQLSYTRNVERIKNGQGLPIEILQSIQALDAAQRDYLSSVQDYNAAQFRLQRALGWPISDP
ncbi:MAG: TolC family protein [Pirellulales bacterium]